MVKEGNNEITKFWILGISKIKWTIWLTYQN
jgi:PhoPQ-activated pathogenicity-related protein